MKISWVICLIILICSYFLVINPVSAANWPTNNSLNSIITKADINGSTQSYNKNGLSFNDINTSIKQSRDKKHDLIKTNLQSEVNLTITKNSTNMEQNVQSKTNITTLKSNSQSQIILNLTSDTAKILKNSSQYPPYVTDDFNINQIINLTDSINWISIVYHHVDEPGVEEMDIIVNGNIVLTKYFVNQYFFYLDQEAWWYNYDDPAINGLELNPDLFMRYSRLLNFEEQNSQGTEATFNEMRNDSQLTNGDWYMIYYHRNIFLNHIRTDLSYLGGSLSKTENITYINDQDAGFEIIQTFLLATDKITDNTIQYWLNQNSTYPSGPMKAVYGTFMTALITVWLNDKLADQLAINLNISWIRTLTTAVMSGVFDGKAYVHIPNPSMGMNVDGNANNVKSFSFICSLLLSEAEHAALGSTGLLINSTLAKIMSGILNGETFDMIRNGTMVTVMLAGDPNSRIIIDTSTGLVWDLTEFNGFQCKGAVSQGSAYCYHDQLTNNLTSQISNWIQSLSGGSNVLSMFNGTINGTQQFVINSWNHIVETGIGLFEMGFGIVTAPAGSIAGPIGIAIIIKGEGDTFVGIRNWLVPSNYWQYCSYHNPWPNYKTVNKLNSNTHMIDSIEVPIKDGKEDWDNAVYINAQNGVNI